MSKNYAAGYNRAAIEKAKLAKTRAEHFSVVGRKLMRVAPPAQTPNRKAVEARKGKSNDL